MDKKQIIVCMVFFMIAGILWGTSSVFAAPQRTIQNNTATPTFDAGINKLSSFGHEELPYIYTSGDEHSIFVSINNTLEIYDAVTYEKSASIKLNEEYDNTLLGVNGNGELAALRGESGFYILDIPTQKTIATYENIYNMYLSFCSFSPLSQAILYATNTSTSGGSSSDLSYAGVDEENNSINLSLSNPSDAQGYYGYRSAVISPDGENIVAGYSDYASERILVWKTDSPQIEYEIQNLAGRINTLDISPDSKIIASGGEAGIIKLWNLETGEWIKDIAGFSSGISRVKFDSTGKVLSIITANNNKYSYNLSLNQLTETIKSTPHPFLSKMVDNGFLLQNDDQFRIPVSSASLVFSPDGSKLALGEGSIQIWDVESQTVIASFMAGTRFQKTNLAFDAKGEQLAILSNLGEVYIWDIRSNQIKLHISRQQMLENQSAFTTENASNVVDHDLTDFSGQNIRFSPDGTEVAFANGLNVEVWNLANGTKVKTLSIKGSLGRPDKLTYSNDGFSITAVTNSDQYFITWDIESGEMTDSFELINNSYSHGQITQINTNYFANSNSSYPELYVDLWHLQTKQSISLPLIYDSLYSPVFNEDGSLFAAIDNYSNLYIWRTDTGQLLFSHNGYSVQNSIAISPNGDILASVKNGVITLLDLSPIIKNGYKGNFISPTLAPRIKDDFYMPVAQPTPTAPSLQLNANNTSGNFDNLTIDFAAGRNPGIVNEVYWKNNEIRIVSSTGLYQYEPKKTTFSTQFTRDDIVISSIEGTNTTQIIAAGVSNIDQISLWNQTKNEQLLSAAGISAPVISPNKKWMVYQIAYNQMMLWNIEKGESQAIINSYSSSTPPVFSPNSQMLAISQTNGLVQLWNTENATINYAFTANKVPCSDLHFTGDGKSLIGIAGGSVWVWSLSGNDAPVVITEFEGETLLHDYYFERVVTAADINWNHEIIAIADDSGTIRFYTLADQKLFRNLSQSESKITYLSFSPKDNQLLSVDTTGKIVIWDTDSSELLYELNFFTGSYDGMVTLDNGKIAVWTRNRIIQMDPLTLEVESDFVLDAEQIFAVSGNGNWIVAYSPYEITLFDMESGKKAATLSPKAKEITLDRYDDYRKEQAFYGAAFSANDEFLITYGSGGANLYKINQNKITQTKRIGNIETQQIRIAALSQDGSRFILSKGEGYLRPKLYETNSQTEIFELTFKGNLSNSFSGKEYSSYTFSPDGTRAYLLRSGLYSDARLAIYDIVNQNLLTFLLYEDIKAEALALSRDGRLLAIGLETGEVKIYNAETLSLLESFSAHSGSVTHLTFSIDGTILISTGSEGAVTSWRIK